MTFAPIAAPAEPDKLGHRYPRTSRGAVMGVRILFVESVVTILGLFLTHASLHAADEKEPLKLTLRSRVNGDEDLYTVVEKKVAWDPKKTALILCDMWDDYWCK